MAITGDGTGAEAVATWIAGGGDRHHDHEPRSGYTAASIAITGSGTNATADATVSPTGSVTRVTIDNAGGGYTSPR